MKPILELIRLEENYKFGTFGLLRIQKEVFCATLEPPDLLNKKNVSSIPAQQYKCLRVDTKKWGETFQVVDVPDRTWVWFHPGNTVKNTSGCILLAEHFGKIRGDRAVLNSGKTFKKFMGMLKGYDVLSLTIKEVF